MFRKQKIGIALSGGGARGLAHIGVLEVLDDLGIQIDVVSGTSMGAIIGAAYCIQDGLQDAKKLLDSADWKSFLMFSVFQLSLTGLVNEKKVDELLKIFLGDKTFKDCKKQFCCVSVDILSSTKIVMSSGSLREAVLASAAIPGIFSPVSRDNRLLVDGSIIEPLPTIAIKAFNPTFVIASSIVSDQTKHEALSIQKNDPKVPENKRMSIQAIIDHSMSIMQSQIVKSYLPYAQIIIEPKVGDFGFLDFGKSQDIIEAGRVAAIKKIPEIKRRLRIR